jgi:hypothetical protein
MSLASVHASCRSSYRQPPLRHDFARRRRIGRRAAAGLPAATIARAEGLAAAEVERLLAEPDFLALVAAYRSLAAMPEPARLERLVKLAFDVLERALEDGDGRTALFVLMQHERRRNPARTIAQGVSAACRRAAKTPPPPPSRRRIARRLPADPLARAEGRVRAKLRAAVAAEHELRHAAEAEPAARPAPASCPPGGIAAAIHPAPDGAASVRPEARGLPRWPGAP